jgi:hypothetical protein
MQGWLQALPSLLPVPLLLPKCVLVLPRLSLDSLLPLYSPRASSPRPRCRPRLPSSPGLGTGRRQAPVVRHAQDTMRGTGAPASPGLWDGGGPASPKRATLECSAGDPPGVGRQHSSVPGSRKAFTRRASDRTGFRTGSGDRDRPKVVRGAHARLAQRPLRQRRSELSTLWLPSLAKHCVLKFLLVSEGAKAKHMGTNEVLLP